MNQGKGIERKEIDKGYGSGSREDQEANKEFMRVTLDKFIPLFLTNVRAQNKTRDRKIALSSV